VKNESAAVNTPLGVLNLQQLAPKRERPTQDAILESLHRIEDHQKEQFRFMQQIAGKSVGEGSESKDITDIENALKVFAKAWQEVPQEERPNKVRKLASSPEGRPLEDFFKLYNFETRMPPLEDTSCTYCPSTVCPHKTELEMLNTLYSDFLKEPPTPDIM